MCIFVVVLMLIVFYALSGEIVNLQLSEMMGEQSVVIAQGWELISPLWGLVAFAFLAGVLAVLLILKLLPADKSHSDSAES